MSKSRDIADSAATINFIDTVTSNVQTQLNTATTAIAANTSAISNISVTNGSLTKTFANGEAASISLTSNVLVPVVSVTKEVPQSGATNNTWDVNSSSQNYTRLNSAPATTLNWGTSDNVSTVTALANQSFGNGSDPVAVVFNLNGTKMYATDFSDKAIYSYTLSTPWDVTTKSSLVNSFSLASQTGNPHGMCFNSDGTIIFTAGYGANVIYKYVCSTAFDISSASYSQTLSGMSGPTGVQVNANGTKLYVSNNQNGQLKEWDLSTAYDLSTASYNNVYLSLAGFGPRSMAFADNGTKLYIVSNNANTVRQYSLSSGFSLSNTTFVTSYDASGVDNNVRGIAFKSDFSQMFLAGAQNDKVYSYNFGTNLTLGSGSFASADVGKTIEANSGVFVLTTASGSYVQTTTPTSFNQVASGSWGMFGVVYNTTDGDLELSGYISGYYDLSAASFVKSLSVSAQDTSPMGIAFNSDGTKMFVVGGASADVNEYTLSIGFDVSSSTFVDRFNFSDRDSQPIDLHFSPDGTKMYFIGATNDSVFEYALSSSFDISTGSYVRSFSINSQENAPNGLTFSVDGTKMFVCGSQGQDVNEYTLSSAFNISTASFVDAFSVSSQDTNPKGLSFNNDGTQLFVVGATGKDINKYSLTAAYDVSTASFVSNFSVASQEATPVGIAFSSIGDKMFVSGYSSDSVHQYSSVATGNATGYHAAHTTTSTDTEYWTDVNSMTANQAAGDGNVYYCISTDDRTTWSVIKNVGGKRDIVRNNSGTWQYNSNATYASQTWANGTTNTELATIAQAMTGASEIVNGYNVSTASFTNAFSVSGQETDPFGAAFNATGTKLFVVGTQNSDIFQYTLSTAFDISSASYDNVSKNVSPQATQPRDIVFNSDGTRMFIVSDTTNVRFVYQYNLSTGFDVANASYSGYSLNVASQDSSPYAIAFNNDGTNLFVLGNYNKTVYKYTLSTGFDLNSTITQVQSFSVNSQESNPKGFTFNDDGTKMYICGAIGTSVFEYTLTTAFDLSSASYTQAFSVSSQDANPVGVVFNNNGSRMYIVGLAGQDINEYTLGSIGYTNQMDKTQLDAVTDPNHIALSNDFDLSIIFNMTSGTTVPSSNGVSINYDANILNQGAVLGTDYNFDAPAQNKVRITALAANNLKVRVV